MTYTYKIVGNIFRYFSLMDINGNSILGTHDKNKMRIMMDLLGLKDYRKKLELKNKMSIRKTYHAAIIEYYDN